MWAGNAAETEVEVELETVAAKTSTSAGSSTPGTAESEDVVDELDENAIVSSLRACRTWEDSSAMVCSSRECHRVVRRRVIRGWHKSERAGEAMSMQMHMLYLQYFLIEMSECSGE